MSRLSHLDAKGAAHMVDVSAKAVTARKAIAEATVTLSADAFAAVMDGTAPKGDVLAAARIAGIMAAKKVPDLIPLCHPLAIARAAVEFEPYAARSAIRIVATVATSGQTGVEMEALTAAAIAALTLYDMIKAVDKGAVIEIVRLLAKSGGKSGDYKAPHPAKTAPAQNPARSAASLGRRAPRAISWRARRSAARDLSGLHDFPSPASHGLGKTGRRRQRGDSGIPDRPLARFLRRRGGKTGPRRQGARRRHVQMIGFVFPPSVRHLHKGAPAHAYALGKPATAHLPTPSLRLRGKKC